MAAGAVPAHALERFAVFGELGLGGDLRPCRGALAVAEGAAARGLAGLVVPADRALEAMLVEGLDVIGAASLAEVAEVLRGGERPAVPSCDGVRPGSVTEHPDLADVRGHPEVIEALILAAAGGHSASC